MGGKVVDWRNEAGLQFDFCSIQVSSLYLPSPVSNGRTPMRRPRSPGRELESLKEERG